MRCEKMKKEFIKSLPIMCSYLFVSMAYGIMMEEAGFPWFYALFTSMTVYTGAFQFVLITFLSSGASIVTMAVTALLMNSRQTFYSLTFVEEFRKMGKRLPYMIHTMTDETYAVNCSLGQDEADRADIMFLVAFFSRCYWMVGAVVGGVLGQLIPFELKGIDFCMTALFVIIFIDQWEKNKKHSPAVVGLLVSVVCLWIFGQRNFMLAALVIVSGILLFLRGYEVEEK
jgi:4-azaleucine resistance transporter AzlC